MRLVQNLASNELVRNLPKLSFERHYFDTCLGSQGQANNRSKNEVATNRVLELLHLDLYGPSPIQSYGGNFYTLMIVDDYSNYTWVLFLENKDGVLNKFDIIRKKLENLLDCLIVSIKTNHSSEFDKMQFGTFCEQHGISYNLSGPFTSQSHEIVERTHRKLRKMSRAMLDEQSIPQKFWCHALDTACYIFYPPLCHNVTLSPPKHGAVKHCFQLDLETLPFSSLFRSKNVQNDFFSRLLLKST